MTKNTLAASRRPLSHLCIISPKCCTSMILFLGNSLNPAARPAVPSAPMQTCNVDRYDVLTGTWTELDAFQESNCFSDHSGVASDDGTMYLFGGYDQDFAGQTTVVKVEISGDQLTFSTTEPMTIVSFLCYVAGGGGGNLEGKLKIRI